MISVLLQLPVLLPVDLLIFFSSLSSMGRISSEHIFLSLALGQTTCTNCTSMDKDRSEPVVMGIYWTAWWQLNQYLNLESYGSYFNAVGQVIPVAGRATGWSLVTHLLLLMGQHVSGCSIWKRVDDSFNDLVTHKQIWTWATFLKALLIHFLPINLVLPKNARQSSKTAGHCSGEWLLERRISSHHCCPSGVLTACRGSAPGKELGGERTVSNLQVIGIGHTRWTPDNMSGREAAMRTLTKVW